MPQFVSVIMLAALILYSVGVWAEKIQGKLHPWHLGFFFGGLVCDTIGTGIMMDFVGGMQFDLHGISGILAIILMVVHAVWATIVLVRKDEAMIRKFHRFSIFVWIVWLVPYFSPMIMAIATRS